MGLTKGQKIGNRHRVGVGYRNGNRRVAVTLQREVIISYIVQDKIERR